MPTIILLAQLTHATTETDEVAPEVLERRVLPLGRDRNELPGPRRILPYAAQCGT